MNAKDCQEKLVFESKEQAEGAKVYAQYRHDAKLKTYQCKSCGLWHLASA